MAEKEDILTLLGRFAVRRKNHILPFGEFVQFVQRYAQSNNAEQRSSLAVFASDTQLRVSSCLEELAKEDKCALEYHGGRIQSVSYTGFFTRHLEQLYAELMSKPDEPFPSERTLNVGIPASLLRPVDVREEFVDLISNLRPDGSDLLRLNFPADIRSIVVLSGLIKQDLLELSLERIRNYLGVRQNAHYMLSKLRSIFRSKEQILRETITSVVSQRNKAVESIRNPTEFTFSFWTHLANAVIKEYRDKTEKLDREHTFCQSAYLIGFYSMHYKGVLQKKRSSAAAFKTLERKLKQEPYFFTVSEISSFTDDRGIPLVKKFSRSELHRFLAEKSKPVGDEAIPEILRLKAPGAREYFVRKEIVLPLTLKKILDASREYGKGYVVEWMAAIEKMEKVVAMSDETAFEKSLFDRIKVDYPILHALLNYELLYFTLREVKPQYDVSMEINRILDTANRRIVPLSTVLMLSQRGLLNQAKMSLPFWKTVPLLNRLVSFLKRFATGASLGRSKSGKRRAKKPVEAAKGGAKVLGDAELGALTVSSADGPAVAPSGSRSAGEKTGPVALQRAMTQLKLELVGTERLETSMERLIEKWNPLYDPAAKANLVEDVNALVRDFLRKLRRGFLVKPPDVARIRNMAETLSNNHAFDEIKKKGEFKRYIELYMIKSLGGK